MDEAARNKSELLDLLSAVWDDRLDAESRARLEDLLAQDDFAAIELLTSYSRLHLDLEWLVSSKAAQDKALASLGKLRADRKLQARRRLDRRMIGFVGIAAGLMLSVFYFWFSSWPGHDHLVRPPQLVGEVVRVEIADPTSGPALKIGDAVVQGQTIDIPKGFAQLSLGYGADVVLEGPCRAQIAASDRVALERGTLAVRAAKWATGFVVQTNDMRATDLGTWFSVKSAGGKSQLHVLEGLVLAKPVKSRAAIDPSRRVTADQAVDLMPGGAFRSIQFRRDAAADRLRQFIPLRPIKMWNTGIDLRVGEKDPHWTVTPGHQQAGTVPQPAIVSAPHGSYGINEPQRSQWISVDRGTTDGVPARSRYTFETTFDLTGFDLSSVWISGGVLADDGVDEVRLNGNRLDIAAWKNWGYGVIYATFHPIEIRNGFVPGINRLAFVVKNETFIYRSERGFDLPETPNPMALRTEWQAFGRPLVGARGG